MAEKKANNKKVVKTDTDAVNITKEKMNRGLAIAAAVVLVIVLVIFYFYRVHNVRLTERIQESYLLSNQTISLEIKNLNEVNQILKEAPDEYFVLISYTNSQDTYDLEKGLKNIIDTYALSDHFYYFNATSIMKESNYLDKLNTAFATDLIKTVPTILYYRDGKLTDTVTRVDKNPINAGDFQKLLDIYDIETP